MPFAFGAFTFGPDGRRLFASPLMAFQRTLRGLFIVDFSPIRSKVVSAVGEFVIVSIAAVNADKVFISGKGVVGGEAVWGIFAVNVPIGSVSVLLRQEQPRPGLNGEIWSEISASPDGHRAVALRRGRMFLLDFAENESVALPISVEKAAWSPDGRWLAINDRKARRTVLLDSRDMKPATQLPWSYLAWSPDSRYLLGAASRDSCGPYYATLQIIDVRTGAVQRVVSSECTINSSTVGWLSSDLSN